MEQNRGSWGSNLGFLLAAIGSAVGLGNIWGFPYKMGKSGGFTFLLIYLLLAVFVGFIIMMGELSLGRKTGKGTVGAYHTLSKKFKWIGWLAVFSPFVIMSFYAVLGGYCIEYMSLNLSNLAFAGAEFKTGADLFGAMLTNPFGCVMFTLLFLVICYLINRGGVSGGIEKFNKIGMPALFVMLVIIIIRSLTLPGAMEGLKFMFVPGYAVKAGFIEEAPKFATVLATAGGQMFFSLSLAMGAMITYGSYLDKKENLVKNSAVIVVADTIVALMAGLAVIPAAVANGLASGLAPNELALNGPKLLFVTLQDVFSNMGAAGPLFGVIFYLLVLLAAISSAISLMEVVSAYFIDKAVAKGKPANRKKTVLWVSVAIMVEAILVAVCGLGSNGIAPSDLLGLTGGDYYMMFIDCWLDFMDFIAEGVAMPLGAMLMALCIGGELKPGYILDEVHNGEHSAFFDKFYRFCVCFIVPVVMAFVLAGMLIDNLSCNANAGIIKPVCYGVSAVILVMGYIVSYTKSKKDAKV